MLRPCFLVVDREQFGSISTRKLVIETAKFNVITAYSSVEAVEALKKFPGVDGVVLDAGMKDMPCGELVARLKRMQPQLIIVTVGRYDCAGANHHLESFEAKDLLSLLQALEPEKTAIILEQDEALAGR